VNAVREVRDKLGWSQEKLAQEAGVSKGTIQKVEGGHSSPRVDTAVRIARALGRPLDELFSPNGEAEGL
jgi:DNA-binding XRE family transcriptional regulator